MRLIKDEYLEGEIDNIIADYRGDARQCPECASIYLPYEHLKYDDVWSRENHILICNCNGMENATVEVWITVTKPFEQALAMGYFPRRK